jgi:acyl transferase domain-containing protein
MAGRYPDARTLAEFWRNLASGVESLRQLTPEVLIAAGVPESEFNDPSYVRTAAVLDDMEWWDAGAWGFAPLDASVMDPQHRLFLECAWEALEDAGHAPESASGPIGVFAGCGAQSYLHLNLLRDRSLMASRGLFLVRHTGNDKDFLATRVSYELDLRGPSIAVQTACSTSLVAVHMAAQSLLAGECDVALAGGVTIEVPHRVGYVYREQEILSPDGHCRSFDAAAAGTVFGSGAGAVVLRRLADAERDGDRILAVIRGTAVNNDGGHKVGYLAPSVEGQAAAITEALAVADLSADAISYVEAHGTGTAIGDPIEVAALTKAFRASTERERFCALGSVKPNIGHLDAAAGIASLTKTVLALQHRKVPPTLHVREAHPDLSLDRSPFYLSTALTEWQSDGPRRAGVSSLGVGGTNAHIILEEAPTRSPSGASRAYQLLTLSAHTPTALDAMTANLADHLEANRDLPLADVAFTLDVGRNALAHRRVMVARSLDDARRQFDRIETEGATTDVASDRTQPVFLFAGGGAQFAGMGAGLYDDEAAFRIAVDACVRHLAPPVARSVLSLVRGERTASGDLDALAARPSIALPALFATQYAMSELLRSWGISPAAMIGHSVGEYTAAHLAGVMSLRDAVRLVAERGRLFELLPPGGMLSVSLSEAALRPMLEKDLAIAAINAPALCVVSGPVPAIERLTARLTAQDIECQRVRIDVAAHSAMLAPILGPFHDFVRTISLKAPTRPYISTESGRWITAAEATDPAYWVRHLRHTVHFADGIGELLSDATRVLVEVGPGRVLTSLARQHSRWTAAHLAVTTMPAPGEDVAGQQTALLALGRLWARGIRPDWNGFWADESRQRLALPTYPWERKRYWIDAPRAEATATAPVVEGARVDAVEEWFAHPAWRQTAPPPALAPRSERVLVFTDSRGITDAVAARLSAAARRVILVEQGDTYAAKGATFTVRPTERADHEAMLRAMRADGGLPDRVLFAWGIPRPGTDGRTDDARPALRALLAFAQALASVDSEAEMDVSILTVGLHRIGGEPQLAPGQALLAGAATVLPREFPRLSVRTVDAVLTGLVARDRSTTARIAEEIANPANDEYVAFRGPDRYVQELSSVRMPGGPSRLRDEGVYLITGGLSGIGFAVACHLARTHRARLALLSRTTPSARVHECTKTIEALGGQALVITADVSNVVDVRTALGRIDARFGVLHGVFHSAGILDDGLIALKTEASVERVLTPKVAGTIALDAAIADRTLDLFVLFSSISSRAGLPGQADYAAANAFLDAFALERSARTGQYTAAIAWSSWLEVGMRARANAGPAVHPLLGARLPSSAGTSLHAATLSAAGQWTLAEHRLRNGRELLPGTAFLEIARAAAAAGATGDAVALSDISFRSPFFVADEAGRELRVHVGGSTRGGRKLTIAGRIATTDGSVRWQEHVTAQIQAFAKPRPRALDLADIEHRCRGREIVFDGTEQHPFVAFGPRWKNLRRVRFGNREALAELTLSDEFTSDLDTYALHPALMDMATAFAVPLVADATPERDFYVPLSYGRVTAYAPLASHILSHARLSPGTLSTADVVVMDITITDTAGHVLVAIEEFTMTRVPSAQSLDDAAARAATVGTAANMNPLATARPVPAESFDDAINTRDGLRALDLVLSGPALPQVLVTPISASALISRLRRRALAPVVEEKPEPAPAAPLAEIEAVLATHESLQQGVVLQRLNRPGERKLVAYVVLAPGESVTVSDLRRFLRSRLPDHLVPSTFVELDALPTQPDGAIDRAALPDPFGTTNTQVAPQSPTECVIAEIWKEVLDLPQVGVHDNFFDVGGHSLLSLRVLTRIDKRLGVRLEQSLMILQTLGQIAAECDRRLAAQGVPAVPPVAVPSARSLATQVADARSAE